METGITIGKGNIYNVGSLVCYGGVADKTTRDSKPHGALKGTTIKSPKILVGFLKTGVKAWKNTLRLML